MVLNHFVQEKVSGVSMRYLEWCGLSGQQSVQCAVVLTALRSKRSNKINIRASNHRRVLCLLPGLLILPELTLSQEDLLHSFINLPLACSMHFTGLDSHINTMAMILLKRHMD